MLVYPKTQKLNPQLLKKVHNYEKGSCLIVHLKTRKNKNITRIAFELRVRIVRPCGFRMVFEINFFVALFSIFAEIRVS